MIWKDLNYNNFSLLSNWWTIMKNSLSLSCGWVPQQVVWEFNFSHGIILQERTNFENANWNKKNRLQIILCIKSMKSNFDKISCKNTRKLFDSFTLFGSPSNTWIVCSWFRGLVTWFDEFEYGHKWGLHSLFSIMGWLWSRKGL